MVESNPEIDKDIIERLMRTYVESYLRRPSVSDTAMTALSSFGNNIAFARQTPGKPFMIDSAVLYISKSKARWTISGTTRVLYFADGKLAAESDQKEYPRIGVEPVYMPELSEPVTLSKATNAFLLCSKELTDKLSISELEDTLSVSQSSEEWMNAIEARCGGFTQYNAVCLLLPPKKRRFTK